MRIRLRYKEEDGRKFPIINVILSENKRSTPPVEALLDSGASRSSFDVGLARILRLPLKEEKKKEIPLVVNGLYCPACLSKEQEELDKESIRALAEKVPSPKGKQAEKWRIRESIPLPFVKTKN